ncbi:MAG TPA: hypothetical protein PK733_19280 [Clostridiales bacterium]|jgi:uncharacterized Fe-S radical SAM superfamily protein PflX|nr:hypothetical protein [Clostridiales bacterium]
MKIDPPIKAKWFYMFASEKIKFNWFCYEYACMLYDHIRKSERLKKWKSERSDLQVAEFCAYFAKRMKQAVLDKLNGLTDATTADEEYIADYCHENTHKQNLIIMDIAGEAWDELLSSCEVCPNRCISERYARSEFFDRMEHGDYFSFNGDGK